MEPQDRPRRDANVIPRDHRGQQGTRRQTRPIDDDALPGFPDPLELAKIGGNLTSRIAGDADIRRCRRHRRANDCRRQRAGKQRPPFHEMEPLPSQSRVKMIRHCGKSSGKSSFCHMKFAKPQHQAANAKMVKIRCKCCVPSRQKTIGMRSWPRAWSAPPASRRHLQRL